MTLKVQLSQLKSPLRSSNPCSSLSGAPLVRNMETSKVPFVEPSMVTLLLANQKKSLDDHVGPRP